MELHAIYMAWKWGGGEATYRNFDSKFSNIFFLLPLYIKNNQSLLGGNHTEW